MKTKRQIIRNQREVMEKQAITIERLQTALRAARGTEQRLREENLWLREKAFGGKNGETEETL